MRPRHCQPVCTVMLPPKSFTSRKWPLTAKNGEPQGPVGAGELKSTPNWNSHVPARASGVKGRACLRIEPQIRGDVQGHSPNDRVPHIIDSLETGIRQQIQVADMRAGVNVTGLQFPGALAGRQRNAGAEITFDEVSTASPVAGRRRLRHPTAIPAARRRPSCRNARGPRGRRWWNPTTNPGCVREQSRCPIAARGHWPDTTCTSSPWARSATSRARRSRASSGRRRLDRHPVKQPWRRGCRQAQIADRDCWGHSARRRYPSGRPLERRQIIWS